MRAAETGENMNQLYPIIRRKRRPLVVADVVPPPVPAVPLVEAEKELKQTESSPQARKGKDATVTNRAKSQSADA